MTVELAELQASVRKVIDDIGLAADERTTWSMLVDLGWLQIAMPSEMAGLGMGLSGASVLYSEMGRGLSTAPYLPALMVIEAICQSVLDERDKWLEYIITGNLVTTSLIDASVRLDEGFISGTVTGVQSADMARHMLVWTAGDAVVALVAMDQPGIHIAPKDTWDITRRLFDVRFHKIDLRKQSILAEGTLAVNLIKRLSVQRDFALAADAIGGAASLLEMTVKHLQMRAQFKRPLAMFQALKHRCADMKASILAAEALILDSARLIDRNVDFPDAMTKAMGAKLFATTMFARVAEDCLQLHGGIGMAAEHPCHLYLKRALLSEHLGSVASVCADQIADRVMALDG